MLIEKKGKENNDQKFNARGFCAVYKKEGVSQWSCREGTKNMNFEFSLRLCDFAVKKSLLLLN